ncbi:MAG: hypothetical protein CMN28_04935 [Salinisphaeraceae bacterium]|nr:hypothetical protein [Salinisphaeraceae bacterium]
MKKPIETSLRGIGAGLAAALLAGNAWAGPLNFAPYVQLGFTHDTNLFRVNEDADGETRAEESSNITRGALGADATWSYSRQEFEFEGFVRENRYSKFEYLDHTDYRGYGAWLYEFGSLISGTLDFLKVKELNNFEDLDVQQKDFRETTNPRLETFLSISPGLRLRSEVGYLDFEHSLPAQEVFNREESLYALEVQFLGKPGSQLGIGAEYIDGEYPDRLPGAIVPPEYDQIFGYVSADWAFSGKSRLSGRLGYSSRDAEGYAVAANNDERDFDGVTGRLRYDRNVSGKTRLAASVYRLIYAVDDVDAVYVESTGLRGEAAWDYSPKLAFVAILGLSTDEYEAPTGAMAENREDDRFSLESQIIYEPIRQLAFIASLAGEERDSSQDDESYDYIRAGLAVRYTLDTEPSNRPLSTRIPPQQR